MEFKESDGRMYMIPSPDETHLLSVITDISDTSNGMIPIDKIRFVKECFEELKFGANYHLSSIRDANSLNRLSEYVFTFKSHIGIHDSALADIGSFILAHPEYEEKEPPKLLSLVDNVPDPDPAS